MIIFIIVNSQYRYVKITQFYDHDKSNPTNMSVILMNSLDAYDILIYTAVLI